jgi:WD40 repeat protein
MQRLSLALVTALLLAATATAQPNPVRVDAYGDPLPKDALLRIGTVRLRPATPTTALVFLADNKKLATASWTAGVDVWDVATGKRAYAVANNGTKTIAMALSPDGVHVATVDDKGAGRVRLLATGKQLFEFRPASQSPSFLLFTPDGKSLAAMGIEGQLEIWALPAGKKVVSITFEKGHRLYASPAFSLDGKALAVTNNKSEVLLLDAATGKKFSTFTAKAERQYGAVAFSPDGKLLAATGAGLDRVDVWNLATGKVMVSMTSPSNNNGPLLFTPDSLQVLAPADSDGTTVGLFDVASGKCVRTFPGHSMGPRLAAISPDGSLLATVDEYRVRLWQRATGKEVPAFDNHSRLLRLCFTPDGKGLLTSTLDSSLKYHSLLRVWDAATGKVLKRIDDLAVEGFVWAASHDGRVVGAIRDGTRMEVMEPATQKVLLQSDYPKHALSWLELSADGKYLIVNLDVLKDRGTLQTVEVWDVGQAKKLWEVTALSHGTVYGMFSADGRHVYVRYPKELGDKLACVSTLSGRALPRSGLPIVEDERFVLSTSGRWLAAAFLHGKTVTLREVVTRQIIGTFQVDDGACALAFSPDGKLLATGTGNGEVVVWDVLRGQALGTLKGHRPDASVIGLACAPDGKRLASGSVDTTVLIWDIEALLAGASQPALQLTPKELAALWQDLGSGDGKRALAALGQLTRSPKETVGWLRKHLPPASKDDVAAMKALLTDLNSDKFAVRERAQKALRNLGDAAAALLEKALAAKPNLEVRQRVEKLLQQIDQQPPSAACLQQMRALQVLELIGSTEARALVAELSAGEREAWLTQEALAVQHRLDHAGAQ